MLSLHFKVLRSSVMVLGKEFQTRGAKRGKTALRNRSAQTWWAEELSNREGLWG